MTTSTTRPGRLIARRYQLQEVLGRGAMGLVWRADDTVLGRPVAVKEVLLPPGLQPQDRAIACERTLREARAIARMAHPNVVTLFDVLDEDGLPWIVMELIPARSLAEVVKEAHRLEPSQVATIGIAILNALDAAHRAGVTHRDVKPGNILIGNDQQIKLTDFGIAQASGESRLTGTGLLVGSPSYIAPEAIQGREVGPPADLFGLGSTLYAAVEGHAPFSGNDAMSTLAAVVSDPPLPFEHAGPLIPVLNGLLEKDPQRRLAAQQVREMLQEIADDALVRPAPDGGPSASSGEQPQTETQTPIDAVLEEPEEPSDTLHPPTLELRRRAVAQQPLPTASDARSYDRFPDFQRGLAGPLGSVPSMPPGLSNSPTVMASPQAMPPPPGLTASPQGGNAQRPRDRLQVGGGAQWPQVGNQFGQPSLMPGTFGQPPSSGSSATPFMPGVALGKGQGADRTRRILLIVLGIALFGALVFLIASVVNPNSGSNGGDESASQGSVARDIPSGYTEYEISPSLTVGVPSEWAEEVARDGVVDFDDPDGGRFLRIISIGQGESAEAVLVAAESEFESRPDYERIQLDEIEYRDYDAALWEFTFSSNGETRHVLYQGFLVDGDFIGIYLSAVEDQFEDSDPAFNTAIETFREG